MGFKLHSWFRRRRNREEKNTEMVLTVTEDTPADMLAGCMELLVQLPREHYIHTERVTVERSTAMMDLLVQIATAHKLAASSYTLQAVGERGLVLPHQPNTPIGALDALQVKLLPKQGTFIPRKTKQANQPFETTFRLQVHLPRNQLYVSRVSPKMNLGEILDEVCREKNLDRNKYELRHPGNHEETLDLSLSLQDYHLQEVTLYAKQGQSLGSALSSQDIMALQRQEERRRHQAKQSVFGFMFKKSKESSVSTDSLGGRSVSPARSDETGRSVSPLAPPTRPQRKRRPAPNPPAQQTALRQDNNDVVKEESKEKLVISHSRNSSDSSGYHEASVLSDHPDSASRMPETLPRRSRPPGKFESRKLAQTLQSSKSLSNLAMTSGGLSHATSSTSLSSTGIRKKRAAPPPPMVRPLSSAISSQALERIVDSEESLTSDMGISKPPSDIAVSSEANSKASSDIVVDSKSSTKTTEIFCHSKNSVKQSIKPGEPEKHIDIFDSQKVEKQIQEVCPVHKHVDVEPACVAKRAEDSPVPVPKPRSTTGPPKVPQRKLIPALSSSSPSIEIVSVHSPENSPVIESDPSINDTPENQVTNISNEEIDRSTSLELDKVLDTMIEELEQFNDSELPEDYSGSSKLENTDVTEEFSEENDSISLKSSCTVISTISKTCSSPLEPQTTISSSISRTNGDIDLESSIDTSYEQEKSNPSIKVKEEEKLSENIAKTPMKPAIFRSQSAFGNLDVIGSKENEKMAASDPENFTSALNSNFTVGMSNVGIGGGQLNGENNKNALSLNNTPSQEQYPPFITHGTNLGLQLEVTPFTGDDKLDSQETVKAGNSDDTTETDILLQKVSTTLATVLPTENGSKGNIASETVGKVVEECEKMNAEENSFDAANGTLNSQQDTSDYVSGTGDDLSGTDWEYQLPDPPSAFRDNASPDSYGYETITLGSVEAFKDPIAIIDHQEEALEIQQTISRSSLLMSEKIETPKVGSETEQSTKSEPKPVLMSQISQESRKSDVSVELRKDVITELETKIENGFLNQNVVLGEPKRVILEKLAPKIAPIDNTLSNFTITTYSRQKSLNIYDNHEDKPDIMNLNDRAEDRIVKTFATLARNRPAVPVKNYENYSKMSETMITKTQSVQNIRSKEEFKKPVLERIEPEMKANVHRSKSYIVLSNNSKYREEKSPLSNVVDDLGIMRATSYTNLNQDNSRSNDHKPSQWREATNKSQNEASRELQSVQVLKSILPQLKNTQQTEENTSQGFKNGTYIEGKRPAKAKEELKPVEIIPVVQPEKKSKPQETATRYRYTGPPAISLGSWSERPRVNVQIKHDTDYKFGVKNTNNAGTKTVVNLNSSSNDVEIVNYKDSFMKMQPKINGKNDIVSTKIAGKPFVKCITSDGGEKDEFKNKQTVNSIVKLRAGGKNGDKPVITDVAVKKSYSEKPEFQDDDVKIDTRPVNFKELTQTFGQVNLRSKPKYTISQNRHSDYFDVRSRDETDSADNKFVKSVTNGQNDLNRTPIKRYTSVVGINAQNTSNGYKSNHDGTTRIINSTLTKVNTSMPVVKGFKMGIQEDTKSVSSPTMVQVKNSDVPPPPPPTMPVITGVTLKNNNARPKSMPICKDPRDQLLDSIRNFGRDKLRNVSTYA